MWGNFEDLEKQACSAMFQTARCVYGALQGPSHNSSLAHNSLRVSGQTTVSQLGASQLELPFNSASNC